MKRRVPRTGRLQCLDAVFDLGVLAMLGLQGGDVGAGLVGDEALEAWRMSARSRGGAVARADGIDVLQIDEAGLQGVEQAGARARERAGGRRGRGVLADVVIRRTEAQAAPGG